MLVLNLKTYPESAGTNLTKLLSAIKEVVSENPQYQDLIYVAPATIDLAKAKADFPELNIIAQHVDFLSPGSTTGWTPAENLLSMGISYSIINHSEHRVHNDNIIENLKSLQNKGLKLIVCCENEVEAQKLLEVQPYAVAYEPKELIGSGISVTTKPEEVTKFVNVARGKTTMLVGAGVSNTEDVAKSMELGAQGVLLASAFVKAPDPKAKLLELLAPFNK
jgi:triosephosphate isomerase (TIM)